MSTIIQSANKFFHFLSNFFGYFSFLKSLSSIFNIFTFTKNTAKVQSTKNKPKKLEQNEETIEWLNAIFYQWWYFSINQTEKVLIENFNKILEGIKHDTIERLVVQELHLGLYCPQGTGLRLLEQRQKSGSAGSGNATRYVTSRGAFETMRWLNASRHHSVMCEMELSSALEGGLEPSNTAPSAVGFQVVIMCRMKGKEYQVNMENCSISGKLLLKISLDTAIKFPNISSVSVMFQDKPRLNYEVKSSFTNSRRLNAWVDAMIESVLDQWPRAMRFNLFENDQAASCSHCIVDRPAIGVLHIKMSQLKLPDNYDNSKMFNKINTLSATVDNQKYEIFDENIIHKEISIGLLIHDLEEDAVYLKWKSKNQLAISTHCCVGFKLSEYPLEINHHNPVNLQDGDFKTDMTLTYFPLVNESNVKDKSTKPANFEIECGVITVEIKSAQSLKIRRQDEVVDLYCSLFINDHPTLTTPKIRNCQSPLWNTKVSFLIKSLHEVTLTFAVFNKSFKEDDSYNEVLGVVTYPLAEMKDFHVDVDEGLRDIGSKTSSSSSGTASLARLHFHVDFYPLASICNIENFQLTCNHDNEANRNSHKMAVSHSASSAKKPGKITLTIEKARNLRKMDIIGSSDPFFKFYLNDQMMYESEIITNNLNPVWDEDVVLVDGMMPRDIIKIVLYDSDVLKKPDFLGDCFLDYNTVHDLALNTVGKWLNLTQESHGSIFVSAVVGNVTQYNAIGAENALQQEMTEPSNDSTLEVSRLLDFDANVSLDSVSRRKIIRKTSTKIQGDYQFTIQSLTSDSSLSCNTIGITIKYREHSFTKKRTVLQCKSICVNRNDAKFANASFKLSRCHSSSKFSVRVCSDDGVKLNHSCQYSVAQMHQVLDRTSGILLLDGSNIELHFAWPLY